MLFIASYILLVFLLVTESLVLAYVLRGTVRASVEHAVRRSSPIGMARLGHQPAGLLDAPSIDGLHVP